MSTQPAVQLPDGPPLPEMREAILSPEDVLALVADLRTHTQLIGTNCKATARQQTPLHNMSLEDAVDRLLDRSVLAIQIHYAYDGHEWTDTLLHSPSGIRLVRCQHDNASQGTGANMH